MAIEDVFQVNDREVVVTDAMYVRCDGGNGPLGHPVEFMTLEKEGSIVCKYCGRRYVHIGHPDAKALRKNGQPQAA
jgi:uncharacterized Zn-finger protein